MSFASLFPTRFPLAAILSLLLAVAVVPSRAPAGETQEATSPSAIVKQFQGTLLSVMKTAKFKSVEERYKELLPSVDATFFSPLMARIVVGEAQWSKSEDAHRKAFAEAFRRYNVANLATMLYTYSGQVFVLEGERPGPQGTLVVDTKLRDSDGSVVKIAYVMKKIGPRWRALDVVLDGGISELTVRKSEYRKTLREKGLGALAQQLSDKATTLLNE